MRVFKKLLSKGWLGQRAARAQWDATLIWFRLRYLTADGPTKCLRLLSRPEACGRIALYFQPGEVVSALYLGAPSSHTRLVKRMANDFGFSLRQPLPDFAMPKAQRLTAVLDLPWKRPFLAHLVQESVYITLLDQKDENSDSRWFPIPPIIAPTAWQLPAHPPIGLFAQPQAEGNGQPDAPGNISHKGMPWVIGHTRAGKLIRHGGPVNLYGEQEAIANWLIQLTLQIIKQDPANLIVLDGVGNVVPRLKRKATVTRLLGKHLTYIDIDRGNMAQGFNPLAALPGESAATMVPRWQRWFQGMNVHAADLQLLSQAQADGVGDIPSLHRWLKKMQREGKFLGQSSLRLEQPGSSLAQALHRLMANHTLQEWLAWPVNQFDILSEGALFFSCQSNSWAGKQMLRAALFAAQQLPTCRLILHGYPWQAATNKNQLENQHVIISNGPLFPGSLPIITQCTAAEAHLLSKHLLQANPVQVETVQLLRKGEGMLLTKKGPLFTTWRGKI